VVAFLLELAQPKPSREPMEVREAVAAPEPPRGGSRVAPGYVRFRINWGERGGAAQNRILAHVCRRGQIRGNQVGTIEIGYDDSTIDVAANVADGFERSVRRPDARDPKLRIDRVRGGREAGGRNFGGKPRPQHGKGRPPRKNFRKPEPRR
jgi:ATP-dependent RNA helicase DeaD